MHKKWSEIFSFILLKSLDKCHDIYYIITEMRKKEEK